MTDISTLEWLRAWARWGGSAPGAFPSLSPMFGERALKSPLFGADEMPPEIARAERCVCGLEPAERALLVSRYVWHAPIRDIATRYAISVKRAWQEVRNAEACFHRLFVS